MIEKFKTTFIEEAKELISNLEKCLLIVEKQKDTKDTIEEIFRIMHTLKGASSMYGFENIGELTHELETIYDHIRNGELALNQNVFNLTFTSIDHIRNLLNDPNFEDEEMKHNHNLIMKQVDNLIAEIKDEAGLSGKTEEEQKEHVSLETGNFETYYILFEPDDNVVNRGINLRAIFEELEELGRCKFIPRSQTKMDSVPKKFYMFWEIFIVTDKGSNALKDVFIFVEDEYKLHRIAGLDALSCTEWVSYIEDLTENYKRLDVESLKIATTEICKTEKNKKIEPEPVSTFYVLLRPKGNLLDRGLNPEIILDDLRETGQCKIISHSYSTKDAEQENKTVEYNFWEIFIATSEPIETLEDILLFVEDEVKILKLKEQNLLDDSRFLNHIDRLTNKEQPIDILELQHSIDDKKQKEPVEATQTQGKPAVTTKETYKTSSIKVDAGKLDDMMNLIGELVIRQAELALEVNTTRNRRLSGINEAIEKITRSLRNNALQMRLVPIENIMTRLKRMVRDLAAETGKKVDFTTEGTENKLDKNVIDSLVNPLMHILRNGIDHGIESPEERKNKGKNPQGRIHLKAYHSAADIIIEIEDDGRGMNLEKIRAKAIKRGLLTPNQEISDKELVNLVFHPGFSTTDEVSELSGRGVGMDVVNKQITAIRGTTEIETKKDKGTKIRVRLPQTLSIVDALLVQISTSKYLIPLSIIDFCSEVKHQEIKKTFHRKRITIEDQLLPYIYLRNEFDLTDTPPDSEKVVIIRNDDKRVGLVIDEVIGEHQAVIKPIGDLFRRQEMLSGASILGDGSIALVLDINRLIAQY